MGRKQLIYSYKMIDAGSMAGAISSSSVEVSQLDSASIHVSWVSTTPSGELVVEAKNGDANAWYQLDFNETIAVTATDSFVQIVLAEMPFTHMRVRYIRTSGTGSLTAIITAKGNGG